MADIADQLESIAEEFAKKVDLSTSELVGYLAKLVEGEKSTKALEILSNINLEMALELKLTKAFASYEQGIVELLKSTYTTTVIPEISLRTLMNITKNNISANVTKHLSSVTMQNIINGIANNQTIGETIRRITEEMPDTKLIVNTAYSQFSNSITSLMAEELPDNTKFIYIGAFDSKTRQRCRDKIGFSGSSGKTRKQILNQYGDMNNELYRCRHKWVQRSSSPADQGFNIKEYQE